MSPKSAPAVVPPQRSPRVVQSPRYEAPLSPTVADAARRKELDKNGWAGWKSDEAAATFLNNRYMANTCRIAAGHLGSLLAQQRSRWDFSAAPLSPIGRQALWYICIENTHVEQIRLPKVRQLAAPFAHFAYSLEIAEIAFRPPHSVRIHFTPRQTHQALLFPAAE